MRKLTFDRRIGGALALGGALVIAPLALAQSERGEVEGSDPAITPKDEDRNLPPGAEDLPPPSAGELLAERERQLDARQTELEQAAKDVELAERRLEEKIKELEALLAEKKRVEDGIRTAKEKARDARLARLTEVTSKMPPENAAAYLMEMSVGTAAKIIEGIKSRKAAAIMAALPPSRAAEIGRKYLKSGNASRKPSLTPGGEAGRSPAGGDGASGPR